MTNPMHSTTANVAQHGCADGSRHAHSLPKYFLSMILLVVSLFLPLAAASERPNIILIFMDDMGYNDVGAFTYPGPPNQYPISGPTPQPGSSNAGIPAPNHARLLTPNIDSLASNGLMMSQFYVNTICSPSRAALVTGRYSKRTSVNKVFNPSSTDPDRVKGLNTTEVTLPEILRERGYATGMIGKWHLGYVPAAHERFQMMPTRHGFMEFFGSPHSNDMASFDLIRGETIVESHFATATKQAEITWRYTEEALDFIQRRSAEEKPFFLYFAQVMTHVPCWPSDRTFTNADGTTWPMFKGSSGVSNYYDVVKEVDHSVGRVLTKLDELGIANNTLVIFTSDNGPWLTVNGLNLAEKSVGCAYPLRRGKTSAWEGGVRVPLLACWPGKIAPGTVIRDQVGAITDFLPTLTGLAGATLPAGRTIDGIDLWPVWSGQSAPVSRSFAHFGDGGGLSAIVKDKWKLLSGVNDKLYDVRDLNDQETTDHAAAQPAVVADLQATRTAIQNSLAAETAPLGGFTSYEVEISENDLILPAGGTATFNLSLSANPNKDVTVSVGRFSGNENLSVSAGANLSFNSSNWATPQTVTLSAAPGATQQTVGATFRVTTNDITPVREVFAFIGLPRLGVSLVWPKVSPALIAGSGTKLVAEGSVQLVSETNPTGTTYAWSKISGPGSVAFTHPAAAKTGMSFGTNGIYQLFLKADHPDADGPANTSFTVDVGATSGETGGLKFSPPLAYDASQDSDGNLVWKNLVSTSAGAVTFSSGVKPNVLGGTTPELPIDPAPSLPFINSAVDFPGLLMEGGASASLDAYSTGNASFDIWFKPDLLPTVNREVIWETGGDSGVSFILEGSTLRFVVADASNGAIASAILVPDSAQDGFIHATGVIDLTNDVIQLYIDGSLANAQPIPGVADWCGTGGTGFAKINTAAANADGTAEFDDLGGNNQLTAPVRAYAGLIAMARFYNRALTAPNVVRLHTTPLATEILDNVAPEVFAGADQSLSYNAGAVLAGVATDDGGSVTTQWCKITGPGTPVFSNAALPATTASFDLPGIYQLWLEADDGYVKVYDDTQISVAAMTYPEWAAINAQGSALDEDFDRDGVKSAIEYVLGGDKNTNDLAKLPTVATDGTNITFSFVRKQGAADPNVSVKIEVGTTLDAWPEVFTVGTNTAGSSAGVTVTHNGNGTDTITLTVPQAPDATKFARLKVSITP